MKLSCILFLTVLVSFSELSAQTPLILRGKVIDAESKEALAYSSLSIKNTGVGTVSDEEGYFRLILPQKYKEDTLAISFLGYETAYLLVNTALSQNNLVIKLQSKPFVLAAIEVKPLEAVEIVRKAIQNIPQNYDYEGKLMTYFYKKYDMKDYKESFLSQQYELVETVAQVYFNQTPQQTQNINLAKINYGDIPIQASIKLIKTRKQEYFQSTIDKYFSYPVANYWYSLDVSMQRLSFLNERFFKKYTYELDSLMYSDSQLIYVISFEKKENVKPTVINYSGMSKAASNRRYRQSLNSMHYGKLYIQADTYAIIKAEYGQNNDYFRSSPSSGREHIGNHYKIITYQTVNDKWYPKYIKIEFDGFSQNTQTKLIMSNSSSKQEILITAIESLDENPIQDSESFNFDNRLEQFKAAEVYEDDYWADYNVLSSIDFKKLFVLDTASLPKHQVVEVLQKTKAAHQQIQNAQYEVEISSERGLFDLKPKTRQATVTFKKIPRETLNAWLRVEELMKKTLTYNGNKIIEKDIRNNQTTILEPDIDGLSLFYENDFIMPMFINDDFFFLELLKKTTQKEVSFDCSLDEREKVYRLIFSEVMSGGKQTFELYIDAESHLIRKLRSIEDTGEHIFTDTFVIKSLKTNQAAYNEAAFYE